MSSLTSLRRTLYLASRTAGDLQAIKRGRIGPRITNRVAGRAVNRSMRGLWR